MMNLQRLIRFFGGDCTIDKVLKEISNKENYLDIYADASSIYRDGKRRCGIGVFFGDNDKRNISEECDSSGNNEAEITACIMGLSSVKDKYLYINMYTDSRLVVDGMNGICSVSKYSNLFDELKKLEDNFIIINWIHVPGHLHPNDDNYCYGNFMADKLSRAMFNPS